jgi:predicted nucleotidyltransferase
MVIPEPVVSAEVVRIVRDFHGRLRERFGSELCDVRLFGSHARGTASEDSDIDVFVLLEHCNYASQRDVLNIAGDLLLENNLILSPTVFARSLYRFHLAQERPLATEIQRQGLRL